MDRKTIKFFLESLFNPYVVDDEFDNEGFNLEVRRIIDDIISIKDNPDRYTSWFKTALYMVIKALQL